MGVYLDIVNEQVCNSLVEDATLLHIKGQKLIEQVELFLEEPKNDAIGNAVKNYGQCKFLHDEIKKSHENNKKTIAEIQNSISTSKNEETKRHLQKGMDNLVDNNKHEHNLTALTRKMEHHKRQHHNAMKKLSVVNRSKVVELKHNSSQLETKSDHYVNSNRSSLSSNVDKLLSHHLS